MVQEIQKDLKSKNVIEKLDTEERTVSHEEFVDVFFELLKIVESWFYYSEDETENMMNHEDNYKPLPSRNSVIFDAIKPLFVQFLTFSSLFSLPE